MLPEIQRPLLLLHTVFPPDSGQGFALVIACELLPPFAVLSQTGEVAVSSEPKAIQPQPLMTPEAWPLAKQTLSDPAVQLALVLLPPLPLLVLPPLPLLLVLPPLPVLPVLPPLPPLPAQEAEMIMAPHRATAVTVKLTRTLERLLAFMSPSRLVW